MEVKTIVNAWSASCHADGVDETFKPSSAEKGLHRVKKDRFAASEWG
jgi:hypothetical protein